MKRSGFTLIELLVVIAIIALLAGIALPVFSAAQERGRATQDASMLRQIGLAYMSYLSDNNDTLFSKSPTTTPSSWPDILVNGKYLPDYKAFHSPFDRRLDPTTTSTSYPVSYGYNEQCWSESCTNMGKVISASQTIFFAPNLTGKPDDTASWAGTDSNQPALKVPTSTTTALGTHGKQQDINALFGDMHVQSMTWTKFAAQPLTSGYSKSLQWYPKGT
ncbi:MAG: type II secretion system protein [Chthoniobacteraceae bacterium]